MKARLNVKSLPAVTEWIDDTSGKVRERSVKAFLEGADALEKLAQVLLKTEMRDGEGRYTTPFFYREICDERGDIRGEAWEDYAERTFAEWRRKYPDSGPAKIASARFRFIQGDRAAKSCIGVDAVDRKWEVVQEREEQAMEFLKACRGSNKMDPGWSVNYLVVVEKTGGVEEESEAVLDEAMKAFPDSAYILSRGAFLRMPVRHDPSPGKWEPWLKKRLEKLPPDAAAKLYATTWAEALVVWKLDGVTAYTVPDVEMLGKGLDLLAAEFPESPAIASQEAYIAMYVMDDRKRAFKALQRAKGRIDLHLITGKKSYDRLLYYVASAPWMPEKVGISPIRNEKVGIPREMIPVIEKAAEQGPKGLEELIRHLRSEDPKDRDGKYNSSHFFFWFNQDPTSSRTVRIFLMKKKLTEDWIAEFPDSPFAKLAAACAWVDWAWDARSAQYASKVDEIQWHGFKQRLKVARKYLMECRELQETEPEWSRVAFTVMLGEGADEKEFEETAAVLFERFPDSDSAIAAATMHFRPKWGGRPGTWEPWLKRHLSGLPADQAAKAYARTMNNNAGFISAYKEDAEELLGDKKPDVVLWLKGLELLKQELPESTWVAAGEAIVHSHFTENADLALAAFKRMKGTIDYDVWSRGTFGSGKEYFDRCSRWVTWKKWEAK